MHFQLSLVHILSCLLTIFAKVSQTIGTKNAAFLHPTFPTLALFFSGNQYAIIDASVQDRSQSLVFGPRFIGTDWPSLVQAGFASGVDAILPNSADNTTAYFFSDGKYALVKVAPPGGPQTSIIVDGPKDLSQWKALNGVGFKSVDGALTIPAGSNRAYVFSGDKYVHIDINPASGTKANTISIADGWRTLKTLGFTKDLDTVLPVPGAPEEAYFFKGDKYGRVANIVQGMHPSHQHDLK